jgi:hypothetical protein
MNQTQNRTRLSIYVDDATYRMLLQLSAQSKPLQSPQAFAANLLRKALEQLGSRQDA